VIDEIDTVAFERQHGHKPRGAGRWVFDILVSLRNQGRDFAYAGPYSVAKLRALAEGRRVGAVKIVLDEFQSTPREDVRIPKFVPESRHQPYHTVE